MTLGLAGAYLCLLCFFAADYQTPAGSRPAQRTEQGPGTILPGGRLLTPFGTQYTTGPGPFGLAISEDGGRIVTANGGPDRFSLAFLERMDAGWRLRHQSIVTRRDRDKNEDTDEDDWKSVFMGLAFDGDRILYASEGDSGQIRALDPVSGKRIHRYNLNSDGFKDSYSGDIAFDAERGLLYVVDQANFRVAVFDARKRRMVSNVRVGRLPFAIALSPDRKRVYVTNIGMFEYKVIPNGGKGLAFAPYGFPSKEAANGVQRETVEGRAVQVPGLGDPNVPESNSMAVIDVADAAHPRVVKFIRTGLPFGRSSLGGSSPAAVLVTPRHILVSNSVNDSISVIDPVKLEVEREIPIRIAGLEGLRGVLPIGLATNGNWILAAEAGINAVGVIDAKTFEVLGHIPAGAFPTRVAVDRGAVYVTNAKGHGTGPNAAVGRPELGFRRGSLSQYPLPAESSLKELTAQVMENNGFVAKPDPKALPAAIKHVVIIVKENRTFDEVFGDVSGNPEFARYGKSVTPNHHALAGRFAMSDNFYTDSEVSVDGHHWLVGSYPNVWTETTLWSAYGGAKQFKLTEDSPGRLEFPGSNSSVQPEGQLEAGTLWHHLERHQVPFHNFGEGFELAGIDEGKGLKPTGARFFTNIPMPDPLYRNTSRAYPGYNTNIPDQFRADQFISEMDELYRKPRRELPRLIFIHLPQDHTADPRPEDGYPTRAAYVADNDLALGRMMAYLTHSPWWRDMAVFVTEDDAAGGVDHVDAHRTVLLMASPYVKQGCVAHTNSSFPGMLKTAFLILRLPPLNLFDAAASDLGECFSSTPDYKPYDAVPADPAVFDPAKVREPLDPKPSPRMDDPREVRKGR